MSDRIERHILEFAQARVSSRIIRAMPCPIMEDGTIKPHVTQLWLADGQLAQVKHIKPVYYETRARFWRPLSEICLYHGNKKIVLDAVKADERASPRFLSWLAKRQRLFGRELGYAYAYAPYVGMRPWEQVAALSLTAFSDPSVEVTSVDGGTDHEPGGAASWDTVHDAATGSGLVTDSDTTWYVGAEEKNTGAPQYSMNRGFALIDTSALTASATISAATLSLRGKNIYYVDSDNDGDDWINIVQSSPASNTAIVAADYDQCGAIDNPTEGATRLDIGSYSQTAYNDFALNATGLTWISKTGVSKFGVREGHDAIDSAPGTNIGAVVAVASADTSGTASDPKIVITYTLPTSIPVFMHHYRGMANA